MDENGKENNGYPGASSSDTGKFTPMSDADHLNESDFSNDHMGSGNKMSNTDHFNEADYPYYFDDPKGITIVGERKKIDNFVKKVAVTKKEQGMKFGRTYANGLGLQ